MQGAVKIATSIITIIVVVGLFAQAAAERSGNVGIHEGHPGPAAGVREKAQREGGGLQVRPVLLALPLHLASVDS